MAKTNQRMTQKAARGQTVQTDYGRDNSSYDAGESYAKFGGSDTNLAHSLPGTPAKQDGTASKDKSDKF